MSSLQSRKWCCANSPVQMDRLLVSLYNEASRGTSFLFYIPSHFITLLLKRFPLCFICNLKESSSRSILEYDWVQVTFSFQVPRASTTLISSHVKFEPKYLEKSGECHCSNWLSFPHHPQSDAFSNFCCRSGCKIRP